MYGIKIIDEICNISKIVGMQVPGRYSILSQVKLSFKKNNKKQNFIIRNVDNRLKRYILEFNGKHIKAEIIAYARPEPILSRSYVEVTAKVTKLASVQSKVALVIGGSRGLGELTTKILCAQGLRVFFSYDSGYEKARQIQNEISAGSGDSEIFKFNIDSDNLSNIPHEEYYEVYYFATPRIVKNFRQDFNFELFGEYQKFYVLGFQRIFRHLCNSSSVKFFYPSTTLIDEPQKGYREYISAKIEGENMINNIVLKQDTAKILVARLPGLLTDQNNDLLKGNVKDPWQSVNQFVQKMHKFN
jgi:hypothetical protein